MDGRVVARWHIADHDGEPIVSAVTRPDHALVGFHAAVELLTSAVTIGHLLDAMVETGVDPIVADRVVERLLPAPLVRLPLDG
jgi:hypothetical protein